MSNFLMAIVENDSVIKEELVGFIPPESLWPKDENEFYLRRPLRIDASTPEGHKSHLNDLSDNYVISNKEVLKNQISVDKSDEEVRGFHLKAVSDEGESRINSGVNVPSISSTFRCDTQSITRLKTLSNLAVDLEAANQAVNLKFRTASGNTVTITSSAKLEEIYTAVKAHLKDVLQKSAVLSKKIETMNHAKLWALNVSDAKHWS